MTAPGHPVGLDAVMSLLACPHCAGPLSRRDHRVVGCPAGHRFDLARQGYLSLLAKGSRTDTGDTADMVAARADFLATGHYRPIATAIADRVAAGPVLEIGAGTGYYLTEVLRAFRNRPGTPPAIGLALDASRYAARRAATVNPVIGSVVADAWSRLPVRDGSVGTVLSVFAPRGPVEIARVLSPGGRVVVVTPEPDHLAEIRAVVDLLAVDPGKPGRLTEAFGGLLRTVGRQQVRHQMSLTRADVDALIRMGPSARHQPPDGLRRALERLPTTTPVTLSVTVSVLTADRPSDC